MNSTGGSVFPDKISVYLAVWPLCGLNVNSRLGCLKDSVTLGPLLTVLWYHRRQISGGGIGGSLAGPFPMTLNMVAVSNV